MALTTVQEIEQAIGNLTPDQLDELHAWLDRQRSLAPGQAEAPTLLEQGLGLFGSPEDAALLDDVVRIAYEERRRPADSSSVL